MESQIEKSTGPSLTSLTNLILAGITKVIPCLGTFFLEAKTELLESLGRSNVSFLIMLTKYIILIKIYYFLTKITIKTIYGILRQRYFLAQAKKKFEITRLEFEELEEKIKNKVDHLSKDLKERLIGASVETLQTLLLEGKVTSVDLLHFYLLRCIKYGIPLNLPTEHCYNYALPLAEERDRVLKEKVKSKEWKSSFDMPSLFGVPVSIKDVYKIKGHDTTLGSATHIFDPEEETGKNYIIFS